MTTFKERYINVVFIDWRYHLYISLH